MGSTRISTDVSIMKYHEKFYKEHWIHLRYAREKCALQTVGLLKRSRRRGVHRRK
jgi:hypothetical protein